MTDQQKALSKAIKVVTKNFNVDDDDEIKLLVLKLAVLKLKIKLHGSLKKPMMK